MKLTSGLVRSVVALGVAGLAGPALSQDCASWNLVSAAGPLARSSFAMAYDETRQRVVVFGGYSTADPRREFLNDTWVWNGSAWSQASTTGPSERASAAAVWDPVRQRVVMFGGYSVTSTARVLNNDTWEWNGTGWSLVNLAGPTPRYMHAMAYDAARARIVMFGGISGVGRLNNDTWLWNGSAWARDTSTPSPSERYGHAMAYDATRQRVVLVGGYGNPPGVRRYLSDVWEWDGVRWTERVPAGQVPTPRFFHAMAYDPTRSAVVLVGGRTGATTHNDTWEWNGTAWRKTSGEDAGRRESFQVAYDSARAKLTLFGGYGDRGRFSDTWQRVQGGNPPSIAGQPQDLAVRVGGNASFSVSLTGSGAYAYQWRRGTTPMSDGGRISGTATPILTVANVIGEDEGAYSVVVTDACGSTTSRGAFLRIICPADLDDGTGTGTPDGSVSVEDLIAMMGYYQNGDLRGDLDDGTGNGLPDQGVTIADLLYFLTRFEVGC